MQWEKWLQSRPYQLYVIVPLMHLRVNPKFTFEKESLKFLE
ncbi:hypothetical protein GEOBRER4_n1606 [Citrifermentans bremense]|uniref:Uncharacterized protein n=1 Tax=Citrifermentans bremense TaxID=60035 RepID=A0A7R7FS39_9BACT|nr:hypothetical protein GEOBRER4_n1606 [Citrifermentans bremense]